MGLHFLIPYEALMLEAIRVPERDHGISDHKLCNHQIASNAKGYMVSVQHQTEGIKSGGRVPVVVKRQ